MNGYAIFIVMLVFFVFFAYYKRDMLIHLFTLQASVPSNALSEELNKTADAIIKRLENEVSHLEYLLVEAEAKSAMLEKQLTAAEHIIKSLPLAERLQETSKHAETDINVAVSPILDSTPAVKDGAHAEKRSIVVAMAEQGYTITEIAKSTGMGKGEIMLLLHLHKK